MVLYSSKAEGRKCTAEGEYMLPTETNGRCLHKQARHPDMFRNYC